MLTTRKIAELRVLRLSSQEKKETSSKSVYWYLYFLKTKGRVDSCAHGLFDVRLPRTIMIGVRYVCERRILERIADEAIFDCGVRVWVLIYAQHVRIYINVERQDDQKNKTHTKILEFYYYAPTKFVSNDKLSSYVRKKILSSAPV